MDGARWNEVYESFKLPAYTLLRVVADDSNGKEVTDLFFDDFVRALSHYGRMAERKEVTDVYLTVYKLKLKDVDTLAFLNRAGFAANEPVTISYCHREKE